LASATCNVEPSNATGRSDTSARRSPDISEVRVKIAVLKRDDFRAEVAGHHMQMSWSFITPVSCKIDDGVALRDVRLRHPRIAVVITLLPDERQHGSEFLPTC